MSSANVEDRICVLSPDLTVKSAATPDFLLENLPETFIDWKDSERKLSPEVSAVPSSVGDGHNHHIIGRVEGGRSQDPNPSDLDGRPAAREGNLTKTLISSVDNLPSAKV